METTRKSVNSGSCHRAANARIFFVRLVSSSLLLVLVMSWPARGWEAGADYDMPLDPCEGAPLNGAASLLLRVTPVNGSFGLPVLVGVKDGVTLWSAKLPMAQEINTAKPYVTCKGPRGRRGVVIDVASQYPADRGWIVQRFRWDGHVARRLGTWVRR